MYEFQDSDPMGSTAVPFTRDERSQDRRRPGRADHANPALITILRNPAAAAVVSASPRSR
jgi:hypothetical protein